MTSKLSLRILVLDDERITLTLLPRMLANLGYAAVTTCDSGHVALGLLDNPETRPDMILLDLNMPTMDGVEFVRHLDERHYTGSLILLIGEDEPKLRATEKLVRARKIQLLRTLRKPVKPANLAAFEKLARAHKIQVLGYLRKPVKPENLAALIEKLAQPPQVDPKTVKKVYGAEELRAAIANGELVNYYHPKVSTISGRVVGMEALVRWNHPEDGMVLPGQFIGVAEAHGLIGELTRVVLTDALAQAKVFLAVGLAQQVSVNISINNLTAPDFADLVARLVANAGVLPHMLVLEIAECRLTLKDMHALLENMTRLSLKRFRLSVDDFATWDASLTQLQEIPFDELKIDMHCVHNAWADERLREKYESCLGLAKQLNMVVVAKGVEDFDDWNFVCRSGCKFAQGFFIARPMPAAELPGWNAAWQKLWSSELGGGTSKSEQGSERIS